MEVEQHPILTRHASFENVVRLGKLEPKHDARTFQLANYIDAAALPPAPPSADYTQGVARWPMYDNDKLGDCTTAAAGHQIQSWAHAAGRSATPLLRSVDRMYWETGDPPSDTGYPGGPTDYGRYELDVLNYWRKTGCGVHKIGAFASINPKSPDVVKAGINFFGGVYTGIWLPITAQRQTVWDVVGDGQSGDSAPGSWGGHAVPFLGYDDLGVILVTWGFVMRATWAFVQAYMDEAYAAIAADFLKLGVSPQGLNLAALKADLDQLHRAG